MPISVVPTFATIRHLALNSISVPASVVPLCVPKFVTTRYLFLNPISVPNSVCSNFCDHPTTRSEPNLQYWVTIHHLAPTPIFNFVSTRHLVSFQSSHRSLSPSCCALCCSPSSTDNSHTLKPPDIGMLPPYVLLDCS